MLCVCFSTYSLLLNPGNGPLFDTLLKVVQNSGVRTPAAVALSQAHMPAQATRLALFASIQVPMCAHSSALLCAETLLTRASQMALAAPRSLVTIADQMMHEEDIDADEYLWETLPGRCCFQELADDCDTCSVWSDPENFCHMSSDNCEHCGAAPAPCGPVVSRTPAQRVRCSSQACLSTATHLRLYWMPTRFAKAIPKWE